MGWRAGLPYDGAEQQPRQGLLRSAARSSMRVSIRHATRAPTQWPAWVSLVVALGLGGCASLNPPPPTDLALATPPTLTPQETPLPPVELPPPPAPPIVASSPVVVTPPPAPRRPPPRPVHRPPPPPVETPPPAPPAPPPPLLSTRDFGADDLRGALESNVRKGDGKVIGRAIDLFADSAGAPRGVTVNLTGFMGVGDRKVDFPWSAVRFDPAQRHAPFMLQGPPESITPPGRDANLSEPARTNATPRTNAPPASVSLSDASVSNSAGQPVGKLTDVLLDHDAVPQAVVVQLDKDKRDVAIAWHAIKVASRDGKTQVQLTLSDTQLNAAPKFESDHPVQVVAPGATTDETAKTQAAAAPESARTAAARSAAAPTSAASTPASSAPASSAPATSARPASNAANAVNGAKGANPSSASATGAVAAPTTAPAESSAAGTHIGNPTGSANAARAPGAGRGQ